MTSHHTASAYASALAREGYEEDDENEQYTCTNGGGADAPSPTVLFSGDEEEEARPVHPDSKALFAACDGRMGFIRNLPIFGRAIEAFGYKFIFALDVSELLSKGIANYTLQYSYYPMFVTRFGAGAMSYQRYQNVAMMGWSIKPLTALISDAFAIFGYTKRWYMVASAIGGTVCCLVYGLLPAKTSSGPIAAALLFLAGYCQANLDILSEGFYSRLMRRVPLAGPSLVATVWWMLSIGNIVASFIEGPLSDAGLARVGAFISGACVAVTIPFFLFNMYGEKKNKEERYNDYYKMREDALRAQQELLDAHAVARADVDAETALEGAMPLEDQLERHAAAKNAALMNDQRELVAEMQRMSESAAEMVGFSMDLAGPHIGGAIPDGEPRGHNRQRSATRANSLLKRTGRPAAREEAEDATASKVHLVNFDLEHDEDSDNIHDGSHYGDGLDDEVLGIAAPRIRSFCGGAIEYNEEVITRNWRITIYAVVMTIAVVAMAIVTIMPGTYPLLGTCVGASVLVASISFWALPIVVAKASLYAFLNQMLYVQITGPLNSFYLATPECLPDGPHFSYFFFNTIASVIGSIANMAGVTIFTYVFATRSYRLTFILTTFLEILGSIFDLIMVKRWNVAIHIPDHVMYVWGDAVVYQTAFMMAWMPMVVLLSQLCPRGSESIVYALLAGFSNMGQTMATEIGTLLMDFAWPVTTTPPSACDFKNLPILIIVCHLCVPLLQLPLVFFLIPGARVCDELDEEGNVVGTKGNSDHGAGGNKKKNDNQINENNNNGSAAADAVTTSSGEEAPRPATRTTSMVQLRVGSRRGSNGTTNNYNNSASNAFNASMGNHSITSARRSTSTLHKYSAMPPASTQEPLEDKHEEEKNESSSKN